MKDSRTPINDASVRSGQSFRTSAKLTPLRTAFESPTESGLVIRRGNQRRFNILGARTVFGGLCEPPTQAGAFVEPINAARYLMSTLQSSRFGDSGDAVQVPRTMIGWESIAAEPTAMLQQISSAYNVYEAILGDPGLRTREVSTAEILRILCERSASVFDARTRLEYSIGHIPGALSVGQKSGSPMSQYVGDVEEIARTVPDRTAAVIVYCNGPFCGKSKRLAEELLNAGFRNIKRYQLGVPAWRALVGPMEIEADGIRYIQKGDQTAVFIDARTPEEFGVGSLPHARNVRVEDIVAAKDDGRLPMDDFNTRVVVFGKNGTDALELATLLARNGFNNVKFYAGSFPRLIADLQQ